MKKVEVTAEIKTKPESIIAAFTEPDHLRGWWQVERTLIDKRPGGLYTLAWKVSEQGFGYVSTGIIAEYQADKVLVVDNFTYLNPDRPFFGPMTLIVKAEGGNDRSTCYICQDGYQQGPDWDWYYEAVRQAWPRVIIMLKEYLEKGK